jgi:ABC-2 type transport system permease protein
MNTPSNALPEFPVDPQGIAPAAISPTRLMYWSVRRELWENRSIYIAPLAVASLVLFAFLVRMATLSHRMHAGSALDPAKQRAAFTMPYSAVAGALIVTAFIVGSFYCLDALHGERRDRSILFWKSLPVSDVTTVLSKASIPLVVLPLIVFAIVVVTQRIMSIAVLLANPPDLEAIWARMPLFKMSLAVLYALTAIALWHAPIYAWLLLISGWARRAAFLWAVLPLLAVAAVERIALSTTHFMFLLGYRMTGWAKLAFFFPPKGSKHPIDPLAYLTPGRLLSTPGLWIGLAFAAAFLAAAVRLRRYREPI